MATDTLTAQPETAEWNPVEAVKSKYPDIGMQDHEIARTLQDPAKFRAAFPEYTGVTDDEIKTKVGKFVDSRPEYQSPVGGSGSELKAAGEGKMVTSFDPDATDTGVKYRGITKSLLPAGHVEKAAGEYAQAPSTLAESDNPTLTGLKKFGAGMVADTAKAGKDMFSSPLGIATLGLGPLAESVTELAPAAAELPVVGKYIRPAAQVVAKYAEPAVRWLGRIAGVGMAGLGGHEAYEGVKEGNTSKTLNGLSSVALGASGAFYPKGGTPEDHAFDAARARKQAKGALPTITVPKGVEPAPLEGQAEGLGNLPKTTADPAEVLNKLGPQAKPAAKTGEALAAVPQPKPAAALRSIPTPVEKPIQESGEALASIPKPATATPEALREVPTPAMRPVQESGEALAGSPLKNPLGSIKTPEAMRASESGEALATVPKSRSSELGAIATPKARPASETGEVLGERPVPDQPITPEVVAKAKALMQASAPGEVTEGTAKNEESPKNEVAKSADEFNKERGLPPVKPEKSKVSEHVATIADEFDKMKHDPTNPEVQKSYDALKKDIKDQWNYAQQKMGIKIEPTDKDPYGFTGDASAATELSDDVTKNKHIGVWRGGNPLPADHPLAEVDPETGETYNTMLRAVHDIFGHVSQGHDFTEPGEESAWKAHMQMMSPEARPAMTTETRGQTSWFFNNKGKPGTFAEQKAGLMPEWTSRPDGVPEQAAMQPTEVLDHIKNSKDYAILQSENPDNVRISEEENTKRTADLKKDLIERGYKPQEVGGNTKDVEGQTEHAFFVPEIKPKDALEIGKKYGQAAILTNEGLHDLKTGETIPVDAKNMMTGDKARQQGYFTQVGDQVFSLPFKAEEIPAAAVSTKSEPKPNTPAVGVNEELTESEKRALAHRIGTVAANDMSPEGQDRASRFLKATQQQIADVANKLGPVKPGGGEWTAKDFSRSGAKGGNLNPNKQGVFLHLQNNVPHEELMKATEDWGPSSDLIKKLKGKGPSPQATPVTARMSDEELKEHGFTQAEIDAGKHIPPVSGGSAAVSALAKTKGIPEEISKHMTPEEIAGATKSPKSEEKFIDTMAKIPDVQEYVDIALAGEGARKWYQRSSNAFDEMQKAAPDYFDGSDDKDKFLGMLAGSSPRQSVAMNLRETLGAWKSYVDAGRPEVSDVKWKDYIKQAKDTYKEAGSPKDKTFWDFKPTGDQWKTEKLLSESFTPALSKVPNVIKALSGEDLWPDLTKNSNFKVPSFANNLKGWLNSVTNDGWMSLFAGLDPKDISAPEGYHPMAVATRAAAEALGWEPAEAQAAIWSFTQALTERGETDPNIIRQYSEDFADLMAHDSVTRELLEDLGVNLGQLDERLKATGEKPEISGRTTATTSRSVGKLKERIEEARGRGAIPPPKSAQGELNFREPHPARSSDADTEFNPQKLENDDSAALTEKLTKQYGDKGKPLSTAFLKPDGTRIPVTDHDVALEKVSGIKGGEESRQKYINDEKVIRQRFRTGREGKEIVFSVPDKVTPEQINSLKESVKELGTSGVLSIERAQKSGPYFRTYNPTEDSVELGLQDIGVLSKEKATTEYSGPLQEDTAEASAQSTWRMQQHDTGRKTPLGRIKSTRGGAR